MHPGKNKLLSERGFSLLEVAVAGSVALLVIMGLFTAVKQASDVGAHVEKKLDERQFLSDVKYVLANPVLCRGTMDLSKEFQKDQEVEVFVGAGKKIHKGSTLPEYQMKVESLKVVDAIKFTQTLSYIAPPGCVGATVERQEYFQGNMIVVQPPPDAPRCFGELKSSVKSYYVDLDIQLAHARKGGIKFRPERLARMSIVKKWEKEEGASDFCQSVNVVRVDNNVVTPAEFQMRAGQIPLQPFKQDDNYVTGYRTGAGVASGGAPGKRPMEEWKASGDSYNPYEHSGRRFNSARTFAPHERMGNSGSSDPVPESIEEAAEQAAKVSARDEYERHMASMRPPSSTGGGGSVPAPAPVPAGVTRPNTSLACAMNMSPEEAADKGLPVVQHGETWMMPVGDCEAKRYHCWEGRLQDDGGPPEKFACGTDPNGLSAAELARQASAPQAKKAELNDCAVNRTLAEAKRLRLPTYKTGERVMLPAGDCMEKSYVCFDGSLRDEGRPAEAVAGCNVKALAGVR